MSADIVKDLLGLAGTVLTLLPFINDFFRRLAVQRWEKLGRVLPGLQKVIFKHQQADAKKVAEPSMLDIGLVTIGIVLLCLSFAVSLWSNWTHPSPAGH